MAEKLIMNHIQSIENLGTAIKNIIMKNVASVWKNSRSVKPFLSPQPRDVITSFTMIAYGNGSSIRLDALAVA